MYIKKKETLGPPEIHWFWLHRLRGKFLQTQSLRVIIYDFVDN